MKVLNEIKMKYKLALLLILPICVMLYFSIIGTLEKHAVSKEMEKLETLSELAVYISKLVHETQKERGASALYIGSSGKEFASELNEQRQLTDQKIIELKNIVKGMRLDQYGTKIGITLERSLHLIAIMKEKREQINSLEITTEEEIEYYTNLNAELLNVIAVLSTLCNNPELFKQISAYVNFLMIKELAGMERVYLSDTFAADRFEAGVYNKSRDNIIRQEIYLKIFKDLATEEQNEYYRTSLDNKYVDEALKMRNIALEKHDEGMFGVEPSEWFKMQTGKINLLKRVEDKLSEDLVLDSREVWHASRTTFIFFIILTIVAVFASILFAYVISLGITRPLSMAVQYAEHISQGDTTIKIEISGSDEVSHLFAAMKNMVENLREQTMEIAEGVNVLASSTSEILAATTQLASTSTETATSVTETTATIEEFRQTAQFSTEKTQQVSVSAQGAAEISEGGEKAVNETIEGMNNIKEQMSSIAESIIKLSEQSHTIGVIIATVDDIAEQSNLLAVNAAIEAAKAGEHGKGFAVVAQEVRNLAEESRQATMQIRKILNDIQKATNEAVLKTEQGSKVVDTGVKLTSEAGKSIHKLRNSVSLASQAAMQITASSNEQMSGITQVVNAMENIKTATSQNVESARQLEEEAHNLNNLGQRLKKLIQKYKI
ncbi:MAG: methyl-accepting chemotaxis protein [Candidatus Kuenenia sp.]|nr:methyl-accepting chemotaxis protein [Candidatus Kuenenia hertensis]